jgi:hypothetical protein
MNIGERNYTRLRTGAFEKVTKLFPNKPLGISKAVRILGFSFEDGGMGDNCPLLPFLLDNEVHQTMVIMLSPIAAALPDEGLGTKQGQAIAKQQVRARVLESLERRLRRATYREFRRRERVPHGSDMILRKASSSAEFDRLRSVASEVDRHNDIVREVVTKRLDRSEMIVIAPTKGLGGLLTGTLAFWPSRIDALFRQGEADAATIFRSLIDDGMVNAPGFANDSESKQSVQHKNRSPF